jgi:tetratricopeptide (TPR) repeat protein
VNETEIRGSAEYEREWQQAEQAKEAGRLEEALERYEASLAAARVQGDEELVDRAYCNYSAVAIALGRGDEVGGRLAEILMRNRSQVSCFLAANNIARLCELRRENTRGLFYARIARDRAAVLDRPEWLAVANNQIANLLLADSRFEEAATIYREALSLIDAFDTARQVTFRANLGYCEVVLGRPRRQRSPRLEMVSRVDLCFANVELGRFESALRHGLRGLALAEEVGETDWIKNALYLLGETAVLSGDPSRAYAWFHELQRRFYPQQRHLPDILLSVDIRKLINLRA